MNVSTMRSFPLAGCLMLGWTMLSACDSNPKVDPNAQLSASGRLLSADGSALSNVEVRMIKFFDQNRIAGFDVEPSVDDLFDCDPGEDCDVPELNLQIEHIFSTRTNADGTFRFSFSGQDIAVRGATADAMGLVEGADLVIVVKDPSDTLGRAGVFTKVQTFGEADFGWDTGTLTLWPAQAEVSFERASLGLVDFTWSRLKPEPTSGRNFYRVEVGGQASAQLVVRCEAGMDTTAGGCSSVGTDRLTFGISTFSLYNYYSDGGDFVGYVTGEGLQYRARAKFTVPASVPAPTGDSVSVAGIWAVGTGSDQTLTNTRADDGDVNTRETISNGATAIYVKFADGASISDAGLLGSLVNNAYEACVTVETNTSAFDTVAEAKASTQGWSAKGKFCGGNGSDRALSALVNFRPKQVTPWLRFVIAPADATHAFTELGEVVAFSGSGT